MSQIYAIADVLGIRMHVSGDTIWGFDDRPMTVGPARLKIPLTAFSDIIGEKESGVFMKVSKSLWFYLSVRGGSSEEIVLYAFDAVKADINEKNATGTTKSVNQTLIRLAPHITAVFAFEKNKWERVDAKDLDNFIPH